MTPEIITIFQSISWASVAGMLIYFVLAPIVRVLINKINGVSSNIEKQINDLEGNHMMEIRHRLDVLEKGDLRFCHSIDYIKEEITKLKERIIIIEVLLKK